MKKQVLVSVDRGETRVAVLEAGRHARASAPRRPTARRATLAGYRVAELYLERRGERSIVGNIYKGKVDNVLAGLEAAFVDIGLEKNGFLHVDEIVLPGGEQVATPRPRPGGRQRITELLKPGQEIVVQVVKDPLKTKGARLSMELTIAGRYMVYTPDAARASASRGASRTRSASACASEVKRPRPRRRRRDRPHRGPRRRARGLRARAAVPVQAQRGARAARRGSRSRRRSSSRRPTSRSASCATSSPTTSSARSIDDEKQYQRARVVLHAHRAGARRPRRAATRARRPLFEDATASRRSSPGSLSRRVDLPSGGYLMIDYAEALTVIDVNTGSFTGRGKAARPRGHDHQDEPRGRRRGRAPAAPARHRRHHRHRLHRHGEGAQPRRGAEDAAQGARRGPHEDVHVVEISPLGLVEMTRQNVTDGVREIITRTCPTCDGEGVVLCEETVAIEFERQLRELAARAPRTPEAFLVQMNPARQRELLTGLGARMLHELEERDRQGLPLRGQRRPAARPLRGGLGGHARRGRTSARVPFQRRARRCSSRSSSRTCTTSTTRSPRSTATSSRSPGAALDLHRQKRAGAHRGRRAQLGPRRARRRRTAQAGARRAAQAGRQAQGSASTRRKPAKKAAGHAVRRTRAPRPREAVRRCRDARVTAMP